MGTISVSLPSDGTTADVADYNTPINDIVNEFNGNIDNANIKSAAAIAGSKLADNGIDLEAKASSDSGWREVTDSWSYASATTITVPTDATTKYQSGDKIKITQSSTVKHFIIQTVATTLLTVSGPDGDTVANSAISDIYYSKVSTPQGMPTQGIDWWQEIGRSTLTGAADTITVSALPARRYLKILVFALDTGGTITPTIRFNNDSGSNYATRRSGNGGADSTAVSQTSIGIADSTVACPYYVVIEMMNYATDEKVGIAHSAEANTAGAGTAPQRRESIIKWANTADAISRVDIINGGAGDFATGSEVVVLGHD